MKKIIFLVTLFLILIENVQASCSDDEITRLSKLANNVTVSYTYNEKTNKFMITFTNVTDDLSINDLTHNKYYSNYPEVTIKNFNSGKHKFYIYASDKNCYESALSSKYIELPYYNKYYAYNECKNFEEYSYCNKWLNSNLSYDIWKQKVDEYNKEVKKIEEKEVKNTKSILYILKDIIIQFYVSYYYIILPTIISSLCLIIYLKNKSEEII